MPQEDAGSFLAFGRSGDVRLELRSGDRGNLELEVSIGTFSLDVVAQSTDLARALVEFFTETFRTQRHLDVEAAPERWRYSERPHLKLGTIADLDVVLEKDGKYDDRYFILVGPRRSLEFAPSVEQTEHLVQAATDLLNDLR